MQAGVYRHYKGGLYQVLGVGEYTETSGHVVVYVSLTGTDLPGPRIRVRPAGGVDGFFTPLADGRPRFVYLGDSIL